MDEHGIQAVAFDVDGTLIQTTMWPLIHNFFGFSVEEDAHLLELYHSGGLSYREWMQVFTDFYRTSSHRREEIEALMTQFAFVDSAQEVARTLSSRYELAVISSSLRNYVSRVAESLSVPHVYAFTSFTYTDDGRFDSIAFSTNGNELEAKVQALKDLAAKLSISPEKIAFVGDSRNDLEAFRLTKHGILVGKGNDELREAAWKQIDSLDELLTIL